MDKSAKKTLDSAIGILGSGVDAENIEKMVAALNHPEPTGRSARSAKTPEITTAFAGYDVRRERGFWALAIALILVALLSLLRPGPTVIIQTPAPPVPAPVPPSSQPAGVAPLSPTGPQTHLEREIPSTSSSRVSFFHKTPIKARHQRRKPKARTTSVSRTEHATDPGRPLWWAPNN